MENPITCMALNVQALLDEGWGWIVIDSDSQIRVKKIRPKSGDTFWCDGVSADSLSPPFDGKLSNWRDCLISLEEWLRRYGYNLIVVFGDGDVSFRCGHPCSTTFHVNIPVLPDEKGKAIEAIETKIEDCRHRSGQLHEELSSLQGGLAKLQDISRE